MNKSGIRVLLVLPYGNLPVYWLPLALGYLKSNLPDYHEVKILDCTFENMPANSRKFKAQLENFRPDVVGASTASITYSEALQVLKVSKSFDQKIVTVMGGPHPTIYPEDIMKNDFVDFLFRGESELSFPVFLEELGGDDLSSIKGLVYREKRTLVKNDLELEPNLDKIKIPDYHALKLNEYINAGYNYGGFYGRTAPIWATRGCPYNCNFCSASRINGRKVRIHSIEYLSNWIDYLYKEFRIRQFSIVDDNFTFYADYAKKFCLDMIQKSEKGHFPEKIFFTTPNGIRMDRVDEELLHLMKKAGWNGVTIAPESGSRRTLRRMGKGLNPDIAPDVVEMIKRVGLNVRGFFMVGYPDETKNDLEETIELIRKCKFDDIVISRFVPFPGTPVYEELVQVGEIPPDYMPPQSFKLFLPFQRKTYQKLYNPPGFENFSLFKMLLKERILLAIRNPYSVIYFIKYYGFRNIMMKLYSLARKPE